MAQITVDFDRWSDVLVFPTIHTVEVLPAASLATRRPLSPRIGDRLIHPDRDDQLQAVQFFDNDSKIIASNSQKNNLQVWGASTKNQIATIETPEEQKFSEQFWTVFQDSKLLSYYQSRAKVESVEDGTRLGIQIAYPKSAIHVWNLNSGKLMEIIQSNPPNQIREFLVSPNQEFLITHEFGSGTFFGPQPDFVRMYEFATNEWIELPREIEFPVLISSDSRHAFALVENPKHDRALGIGIYRFPDFKLIRQIDMPPELIDGSQLMLSNDERFVIAAFKSYPQKDDRSQWYNTIASFEVATGKSIATYRFPVENDSPSFAHRHLDDGTLVYWNWKGETKNLVGLETPMLTKKWETKLGDYEVIRSARVEPGGKWIAVIGYPDDSKFGLRNTKIDWELVPQTEMLVVNEAGKVLEELILPAGASTIAFQKDGKSAALGGVGSVYLIDFSAPFANDPKSK